MKKYDTLWAGMYLFAVTVGWLCLSRDAIGEMRVWKSTSGKHEVSAEFVSTDSHSVTLRTEDGRQLTIELAKLSQEDQDFVASCSAEDRVEDDESQADEKQLRRLLLQFYRAVERDREGMKSFLTAAGQSSFDSNPTFFESLRGPDRGERVRVGNVQVGDDSQTAIADYRLRMGGKSWQMQMLFVSQDDGWRVAGIAGPDPDGNGKNQMNFDTATQVSLPDGTTPTVSTNAPRTPAVAVQSTRGAAAYAAGFCAKCHGEQGTGTGKGPDLTDDQWDHCDGSAAGIREVLVSGVPKEQVVDPSRRFGMNPATYLVAEEELDALAEFVHAMRTR